MSEQNPGHQPGRFETYTSLPGGKGFKIKGNDHVFKFDSHGGWFDEYGNYYNYNGEASDPPSDEESYSDRSDDGAYHHDDEDQYEKQFGRPKDIDDDHDDTHSKAFHAITQNVYHLHHYPPNTPLRVNFKNINFHTRKDDLWKIFNQKTQGVINIIQNRNQKGFDGSGYLVVKNAEVAEVIIRLEGEKLTDREVRFEIEDFQQSLIHPLNNQDLKVTTITIGKKKEETKVQPKVEKVQVKKVEPTKVEAKKVEEKQKFVAAPVLKWYKFQKKAFPKKSSFKDWMIEHKFVENVDFTTVEKIPENTDFAKIQMKEGVFTKLNNTFYLGNKITFTAL